MGRKTSLPPQEPINQLSQFHFCQSSSGEVRKVTHSPFVMFFVSLKASACRTERLHTKLSNASGKSIQRRILSTLVATSVALPSYITGSCVRQSPEASPPKKIRPQPSEVLFLHFKSSQVYNRSVPLQSKKCNIYITNRRSVSAVGLVWTRSECCYKKGLTKRMTTGKLWFLGISCLQLIPDPVQQLHVTLLWVLLQSSDESPGHGTSGLRGNRGVGSMRRELATVSLQNVARQN